jgi:hypothetical protein
MATVSSAKVSDSVLRQPLLFENGDVSKKLFMYYCNPLKSNSFIFPLVRPDLALTNYPTTVHNLVCLQVML